MRFHLPSLIIIILILVLVIASLSQNSFVFVVEALTMKTFNCHEAPNNEIVYENEPDTTDILEIVLDTLPSGGGSDYAKCDIRITHVSLGGIWLRGNINSDSKILIEYVFFNASSTPTSSQDDMAAIMIRPEKDTTSDITWRNLLSHPVKIQHNTMIWTDRDATGGYSFIRFLRSFLIGDAAAIVVHNNTIRDDFNRVVSSGSFQQAKYTFNISLIHTGGLYSTDTVKLGGILKNLTISSNKIVLKQHFKSADCFVELIHVPSVGNNKGNAQINGHDVIIDNNVIDVEVDAPADAEMTVRLFSLASVYLRGNFSVSSNKISLKNSANDNPGNCLVQVIQVSQLTIWNYSTNFILNNNDVSISCMQYIGWRAGDVSKSSPPIKSDPTFGIAPWKNAGSCYLLYSDGYFDGDFVFKLFMNYNRFLVHQPASSWGSSSSQPPKYYPKNIYFSLLLFTYETKPTFQLPNTLSFIGNDILVNISEYSDEILDKERSISSSSFLDNYEVNIAFVEFLYLTLTQYPNTTFLFSNNKVIQRGGSSLSSLRFFSANAITGTLSVGGGFTFQNNILHAENILIKNAAPDCNFVFFGLQRSGDNQVNAIDHIFSSNNSVKVINLTLANSKSRGYQDKMNFFSFLYYFGGSYRGKFFSSLNDEFSIQLGKISTSKTNSQNSNYENMLHLAKPVDFKNNIGTGIVFMKGVNEPPFKAEDPHYGLNLSVKMAMMMIPDIFVNHTSQLYDFILALVRTSDTDTTTRTVFFSSFLVENSFVRFGQCSNCRDYTLLSLTSRSQIRDSKYMRFDQMLVSNNILEVDVTSEVNLYVNSVVISLVMFSGSFRSNSSSPTICVWNFEHNVIDLLHFNGSATKTSLLLTIQKNSERGYFDGVGENYFNVSLYPVLLLRNNTFPFKFWCSMNAKSLQVSTVINAAPGNIMIENSNIEISHRTCPCSQQQQQQQYSVNNNPRQISFTSQLILSHIIYPKFFQGSVFISSCKIVNSSIIFSSLNVPWFVKAGHTNFGLLQRQEIVLLNDATKAPTFHVVIIDCQVDVSFGQWSGAAVPKSSLAVYAVYMDNKYTLPAQIFLMENVKINLFAAAPSSSAATATNEYEKIYANIVYVGAYSTAFPSNYFSYMTSGKFSWSFVNNSLDVDLVNLPPSNIYQVNSFILPASNMSLLLQQNTISINLNPTFYFYKLAEIGCFSSFLILTYAQAENLELVVAESSLKILSASETRSAATFFMMCAIVNDTSSAEPKMFQWDDVVVSCHRRDKSTTTPSSSSTKRLADAAATTTTTASTTAFPLHNSDFQFKELTLYETPNVKQHYHFFMFPAKSFSSSSRIEIKELSAGSWRDSIYDLFGTKLELNGAALVFQCVFRSWEMTELLAKQLKTGSANNYPTIYTCSKSVELSETPSQNLTESQTLTLTKTMSPPPTPTVTFHTPSFNFTETETFTESKPSETLLSSSQSLTNEISFTHTNSQTEPSASQSSTHEISPSMSRSLSVSQPTLSVSKTMSRPPECFPFHIKLKLYSRFEREHLSLPSKVAVVSATIQEIPRWDRVSDLPYPRPNGEQEPARISSYFDAQVNVASIHSIVPSSTSSSSSSSSSTSSFTTNNNNDNNGNEKNEKKKNSDEKQNVILATKTIFKSPTKIDIFLKLDSSASISRSHLFSLEFEHDGVFFCSFPASLTSIGSNTLEFPRRYDLVSEETVIVTQAASQVGVLTSLLSGAVSFRSSATTSGSAAMMMSGLRQQQSASVLRSLDCSGGSDDGEEEYAPLDHPLQFGIYPSGAFFARGIVLGNGVTMCCFIALAGIFVVYQVVKKKMQSTRTTTQDKNKTSFFTQLQVQFRRYGMIGKLFLFYSILVNGVLIGSLVLLQRQIVKGSDLLLGLFGLLVIFASLFWLGKNVLFIAPQLSYTKEVPFEPDLTSRDSFVKRNITIPLQKYFHHPFEWKRRKQNDTTNNGEKSENERVSSFLQDVQRRNAAASNDASLLGEEDNDDEDNSSDDDDGTNNNKNKKKKKKQELSIIEDPTTVARHYFQSWGQVFDAYLFPFYFSPFVEIPLTLIQTAVSAAAQVPNTFGCSFVEVATAFLVGSTTFWAIQFVFIKPRDNIYAVLTALVTTVQVILLLFGRFYQSEIFVGSGEICNLLMGWINILKSLFDVVDTLGWLEISGGENDVCKKRFCCSGRAKRARRRTHRILMDDAELV